MKPTRSEITTIDQYIEQCPAAVQDRLRKVRATIKRAAPDAVEKISYRIPTFYYHGNLVHFAAFTKHIGFYPTSSGIAAFKDDLAGYKNSKGAVQFPNDERLPLGLIARIVRFRVKENARKGGGGGRTTAVHAT
jgi:uncharacterized protein YdhG (YjbR/CyaY superfamily)